ncbi:unnamed protein product [Plasmodium vivax]|uniref:(malaria parasite P. vivax) hypothetical protein n=1 Tax=Plasmodium vivax TaxID=5855 RepID=A0A8S4H2B3_PLAVI|nr:unnamed protein product [Plasmodium vivax]
MTKGDRIKKGVLGRMEKWYKEKKLAKKMGALMGKRVSGGFGVKRNPEWWKQLKKKKQQKKQKLLKKQEQLKKQKQQEQQKKQEQLKKQQKQKKQEQLKKQQKQEKQKKQQKQQKQKGQMGQMGQGRKRRAHNEEEDEEQMCRSNPYGGNPFGGTPYGENPYGGNPYGGHPHRRATGPDRHNAPGRQNYKVKRIDGVGIGKKRRSPPRTEPTWEDAEHENGVPRFMQKNGRPFCSHYLDDLRRIYFCTGRTADAYSMMASEMDANARAVLGEKRPCKSAPPRESQSQSQSSPQLQSPPQSQSSPPPASPPTREPPVRKDQTNGLAQRQYLESSTIELFYNLGKEVTQLTHLMKPRRHEIAMREKLVKEVERFIRGIYPEVYMLIFGSCNTDLDLYNADVDICIYNRTQSDINNVYKLYGEMKSNKLFENANIKPIINAKVPIIKCFFTNAQISIDFSFNQVSAIISTVETQNALKENPLIKYIIIFFKIFLLQNDLNDAFQGGISSYKLFLIFVRFMKEHCFVFSGKNSYLYIGEVVYKFVSYLSLFRDKSEECMDSFFSFMCCYDSPDGVATQGEQSTCHAATQSRQTIEILKRRKTKVVKKIFRHMFCRVGETNQGFNAKRRDLSFDKLFQVRQCMKEVLYSLSDVLIYLVRKKTKNISPEYDAAIFADALSIVSFFHFLREERLNRLLLNCYAFFHQKVLCIAELPPRDDLPIEVCEGPNGAAAQQRDVPPHSAFGDDTASSPCGPTASTEGAPPLMSYFQRDTLDEVQANVNQLYRSMGNKASDHNRLVRNVCSELVILNTLLDLNKVLTNRFHYHQIFLPAPQGGNPQDEGDLAARKLQMLSDLARFKNYNPSEVMGLEIKSEFFVNSADTVFGGGAARKGQPFLRMYF